MVRAMSLTEALFGIPSDIEVQPEITNGFLATGLSGLDEFRRYLYNLGYTDGKLEEILIEIYREVKKRCLADPSYEELLAVVCSEIGSFYLDMNHDRAEKFLLEAFNLRSKLYGSKRAYELARTMNRLGIFYVRNEKFEKAELMFEDAYTILKELYEEYGVDEEDYAIAALNLGTFYYETYRAEIALKYLLEALKHRNALPCNGAAAYHNLALAYEDLENFDRAAECYFKAACIEFLDRYGIVNVKELLQKACNLSKNHDYYAFYLGYLVLEGDVDFDSARKELAGLELDRCKALLEALNSGNMDTVKKCLEECSNSMLQNVNGGIVWTRRN